MGTEVRGRALETERGHRTECSVPLSHTQGKWRREQSDAHPAGALRSRAAACSVFHFMMQSDTCSAKTALHFDLPNMQQAAQNSSAMLDGSREPKLQVSHSTMKVTETLTGCGNLCL